MIIIRQTAWFIFFPAGPSAGHSDVPLFPPACFFPLPHSLPSNVVLEVAGPMRGRKRAEKQAIPFWRCVGFLLIAALALPIKDKLCCHPRSRCGWVCCSDLVLPYLPYGAYLFIHAITDPVYHPAANTLLSKCVGLLSPHPGGRKEV